MTSVAKAASPLPPAKPLHVHDRCQVQWCGGQQSLPAVIVERRPHRDPATNSKRKRRTCENSVDTDSLPADAVDYYVHYIDHDRCVEYSVVHTL